MNRWLLAVVLGLAVAGCAEGVEDPQPAPPPAPTQKPAPAQTFSEEVPGDTGDPSEVPALPPRQLQVPPMPGQGGGE
jgi:hypothetical protein